MNKVSQEHHNYLEEMQLQAQIQEELLKKVATHRRMLSVFLLAFTAAAGMGIIFSQQVWLLLYPFLAMLLAYHWRHLDEQILTLRKAFYSSPLPQGVEFEGGKEMVWVCLFFGKLLGEVRQRLVFIASLVLISQLLALMLLLQAGFSGPIQGLCFMLASATIPLTARLLLSKLSFSFVRLQAPYQLSAG